MLLTELNLNVHTYTNLHASVLFLDCVVYMQQGCVWIRIPEFALKKCFAPACFPRVI